MIGLGFTGGMDSTMLLYELLQETEEQIVCVTNDIRSRNTVAYKNSAKVLEYFESDRITPVSYTHLTLPTILLV